MTATWWDLADIARHVVGCHLTQGCVGRIQKRLFETRWLTWRVMCVRPCHVGTSGNYSARRSMEEAALLASLKRLDGRLGGLKVRASDIASTMGGGDGAPVGLDRHCPPRHRHAF
jgi:hypothetical protein